MLNIPKKVSKRISTNFNKYVKILELAKQKDVNESDTVKVIRDILCDVFGYDKYLDITSEYEVKGKYCDIAIKVKDVLYFLIECKAIGITLKESHLNQALFYSERLGIDWAILTNGIRWKVYKIHFGKPMSYQLLFEFDFLKDFISDESFQEKLYVLSKEALYKSAIATYHEEKSIVNKFTIAALLQRDNALNLLRRDLRSISKGIRVENDQILDIIKNDVLKRDLFDCNEAKEAEKKIKKAERKKNKSAKN